MDDWNQKKISLLESKEKIDDALLNHVANALRVTPDAIKSFNDEVAINIVSSTLNDNAGSINNSCTLTFNPIDKWMEAMEENRKLYERLLQSEREKVELLDKVLDLKK